MEPIEAICQRERELRKQKVQIVNGAIAKAGSIASLSRALKVQRHTIRLWALGVSDPSENKFKNLISWLQTGQIKSEKFIVKESRDD